MTNAPLSDLEKEYDNRARVPEHPEIIAGWVRDSAAYRAQAGHAELGRSYGPHPRQLIDVFHPDRPAPMDALVVFIHGGYWRSFDPSSFSHMAAGASARGLSVAIPGYRLCPEVTVAEIIVDLRSACVSLYETFGKPIVACGHSAGGHLAAAVAATDWRAMGAPEHLVRRGLSISGLFDLTPLLATSINQSLRLDPASARAASPLFWPVPAGVRLEAWVGGAESAEYRRQSRSLAGRWGARGARTVYNTVPGRNHFTVIAPLADPASLMMETLLRLCRSPE